MHVIRAMSNFGGNTRSGSTCQLRAGVEFGTMPDTNDQDVRRLEKKFTNEKKTIRTKACRSFAKQSVTVVSLSAVADGGATGTAPVSEKVADDGDGSGDGDPDSDRKQLSSKSKSPHAALVQSAKSKCILRMPVLKVRIGLSRSTIYEAVSKGEFPAPISLGPRAVGWLESDVDAWLESRIAASKAT